MTVSDDGAVLGDSDALNGGMGLAIVSRQVWQNAVVGFLYREAAAFADDSGWRIFSGEEDDDFADDADNFHAMPLQAVLDAHPEIAPLMQQTAGAWEWNEKMGQFVAVADWSPRD